MHHLCTNRDEIAKLFFATAETDNSRKNNHMDITSVSQL